MPRCLIGLGSNVGDRAANLDQAAARFAQLAQVRDVTVSSYHGTRPIGGPAGQSTFLNAALLGDTYFEPGELLQQLHEIERQLGRTRGERWGERTIDLDLLLYDQREIHSPELTIPHPRLAFRRFVLTSAAEIAAEMLHPATGLTIGELLERLDQVPAYVAVTGELDDAARWAVRTASARVGSRYLPAPPRSVAGPPHVDLPSLLDDLSAHVAALQAAGPVPGAVSASEYLISDFWCGELLARASFLPEEDRSLFIAAWSAIPPSFRQPKLLIYQLPGEPWEPASSTEEQPLRQLAGKPRQFPVLWLPAANIEILVQEIVASVLAMQPAD